MTNTYMTNNYIIRQIYKKYLPVSVIATMGATLGQVVGGAITGRFLGGDALAAFGLCSPLFILTAALAGILGTGSTGVCSGCIGRGEKERVNQIFTVVMLVTVAASCLIGALLFCFSRGAASLLGAKAGLMADTSAYVRGLSLAVIPLVICQVLSSFTRMDGSPSLGMVSILFMAVGNILFALANVFWLRLGLFGMGLATAFGYLIATLVLCLHFPKKINTLRLVRPRAALSNLRQVVVVGTPNAVNRLCNTIRSIFVNHTLMLVSGSAAVAAYSVQTSLHGILYSVCLGVSTTTMLVSGIFYGEEDRRSLRDSLRLSLRLGVLLTAGVSVLSIVFVRFLVGIFSRDAQVAELAVRAMICYLISIPLSCVNDLLPNYYASTGHVGLANLICAGNSLLFVVLSILACTPLLGADGVWISFILAELADLVVTYLIVWRKNRRRPRCTDDLLLLREPFGVTEENRKDLSLQGSMDEVVELSRKVEAFLKARNADPRRTYLLSLCVEELAGNVVQYAFGDGKKTHYIDIRVLFKNGELIFRMRDDGKPFDPLRKLNDESEGVEKNIGIRMVGWIAKRMDYRYTVGMNNLIVRL